MNKKNYKTKYFYRSDIQDFYYRHTGSLSTALRQLIFAEGAATWMIFIYKPESTCKFLFLSIYIIIFFFLLCDVLQYWHLSDNYQKVGKEMDNAPKPILKIDQDHAQSDYQTTFFEIKRWSATIATIVFTLNAIMVFK